MSKANSFSSAARTRYTLTAIVLHWLLALLLVGLFCVGVYMADLPFSPTRLKLYNWHKWCGIVVLTLSLVRLLWRLTHRPPELPAQVVAGMPAWQQAAHHATHGLLYVLFFAVPLIGWAYSNAAGFPIVVFGVLPLPNLLEADKALAELIKPWHGYAAFALAGLVVLHVLAALKHQLVDRDGLVQRMLPAR
jgi:cytochrome b561